MLQGVFIFKRVFKGDLDVGGGPEGELKGNLEGDLEIRSVKVQIKSGPGLVQYRAQI